MHKEAVDFMHFCHNHFLKYFVNTTALDVGSGDINGNNRYLFDSSCEYNGNDVHHGPNVTIVSKTSELPFSDNHFDVIVSTECFEHDAEYAKSFSKILKMLKPGGLFAFTCASTGREEHGTRRSLPHASLATIGYIEGWPDYYKNLTIEDVDEVLDIFNNFNQYSSYYNYNSKDLYFWGIKKGKNIAYNIPEYISDRVINTSDNCRKLIQIISVDYGISVNFIDVTETFIQHFYRSGEINVSTSVNLNRIFGNDPALYHNKCLIIRCMLRGSKEELKFTLQENLEYLIKPFRLILEN